MPKTCIINFAKGAWYPDGQKRLLDSLATTNFSKIGDVFAFKSESELKCPPHSQIPYGFKIAAFNHAANLGYKIILWCDAACWALKSVEPLIEHIEREGHVLFYGGWNCAQWTSDACLKQMQVSRDDAEKMQHYMACCMGLNLESPRSAEFLKRLNQYAWDNISFPGSWTNKNHEVSNDPRCLGHRHDQAVGSIIANQLGMNQIIGHETFFSYWGPNMIDSVVIASQGMPASPELTMWLYLQNKTNLKT